LGNGFSVRVVVMGFVSGEPPGGLLHVYCMELV